MELQPRVYFQKEKFSINILNHIQEVDYMYCGNFVHRENEAIIMISR